MQHQLHHRVCRRSNVIETPYALPDAQGTAYSDPKMETFSRCYASQRALSIGEWGETDSRPAGSSPAPECRIPLWTQICVAVRESRPANSPQAQATPNVVKRSNFQVDEGRSQRSRAVDVCGRWSRTSIPTEIAARWRGPAHGCDVNQPTIASGRATRRSGPPEGGR